MLLHFLYYLFVYPDNWQKNTWIFIPKTYFWSTSLGPRPYFIKHKSPISKECEINLRLATNISFVFGLAVMFFNSWRVQKWVKYLNSLCWLLRLHIGAAWRFWWGNRFEKLLSRKKNYVTSNYRIMGDLNFFKKKLIYSTIEKKNW